MLFRPGTDHFPAHPLSLSVVSRFSVVKSLPEAAPLGAGVAAVAPDAADGAGVVTTELLRYDTMSYRARQSNG